MAGEINREKCYEDAVLNIVRNEDFKNTSADMIEKIALFAVHYAEAGYDKGYDDGALRIGGYVARGRVEYVEQAERLITAATDFKNTEASKESITINYPKADVTVSYEIKVKENEGEKIVEQVVKQLKRILKDGILD